jgi:hypothetical protein
MSVVEATGELLSERRDVWALVRLRNLCQTAASL